ncbi:hypothetical protein EI94DRAFT_560439 [Lactarius quietus]|nr:hypothetical protein EI94DRAFT_560439 [Lactarius quietus]
MGELEADGVSTVKQYRKVEKGQVCQLHASSTLRKVIHVFLLPSGDTNGQSVINRNPLSDIPHKDFVPLMGPLLVPEHYPSPESPWPPLPFHRPHIRRTSAHYLSGCTSRGRSVKTTLSNLKWIDSLTRERRWRPQCVFSVDAGRCAKQGIEAHILHADVLFLNQRYAQAQSPAYSSAPRVFQLALTRLAPPTLCSWPTGTPKALQRPPFPRESTSNPQDGRRPPTPVANVSSPSSSISANTTP